MQTARCTHGHHPWFTRSLCSVLGVPAHITRPWRANVLQGADAAGCQRPIAARAVKPEDVLQSDAVRVAAAATAARPPWRWEESEDATKAYGALAATLLFGLVPGLETQKWADLPYFVSLALCTIYIGAHRGLTTSSRQQISVKEGILAPVFASGALFGCYLLIKFFPDLNLQTLLNAYFFILGSIAISTAAVPLLRRKTGSLGQKSIRFDAPEGLLLDDQGKSVTRVELAPTDLVAVALAVGLAAAELAFNHSIFSLNNLVACLVASEILQLLGIRSFRTAAVLLLGLLCYDVFWVFASPSVVGDNVMLTVATSDAIVGPTRLLFPKAPGAMGEAASFPYSLLGLGDVAVPGLLACLALRYDASRSVDMRARATAAAEAISDALGAMDASATAEQMGEAAADAASTAYDRVADQELQQRNSTLNGNGASPRSRAVSSSQSGGNGVGGMPGSNSSSLGEIQQAERMHVSDAVLEQRTYFKPVLGAYVFGLLSAFAANSITSLGQPALLYIVPATLSAVFVTAASRNELGRVWSFTDVPTFGLQQSLLELEQEDERSKG